jgi:rhamnosyltransferase
MMLQEKVHAVIVAFHPEEDRFLAALETAARQVSAVVVVDNGNPASRVRDLVRRSYVPGCTLLSMETNVGVAAAQNAGLRQALSAGADHVLLLDDDSVPGDGMVERLLDAVRDAAARGARVAAAGPRFVEQQSGVEASFIRYGRFGAMRMRCGDDATVLQTDALIASGMLIPAASLREVGLMDETLFIDHVDTDWCMRARARGYALLGVCGATLSHRLGDHPSFSIAGRRIFFRSPDRHYYMFRNSILLYRRPHAPRGWVLGDALRLPGLFLAIAACCAPRAQHIVAMASGIAHGFRGRMGPRRAA